MIFEYLPIVSSAFNILPLPLQELLGELEYQLPRIDPDAWGKVYFLEKRCRLVDFNIKSPAVIIDGSKFQYPGR